MSETKSDSAGWVGRRALLRGGSVAAAGAVLTAPAAPYVARAQVPRRLRMAMPWPKGTPGVGVNAERIASMISTMSAGRLEVEVFGAGELVPPFEVFDAVSAGTADLGHGTPYYWQGKDPAMHFFTGVPMGLTTFEHMGWLYYGGGQNLWERVYEPFGVVPYYAGSSGPQAGGWFSREITGVDDLQGLKMRIAGLGGEVLRRLGVNVVLMPPGEIFSSLQSGAIDAAEWIGPWNDLAFGLFRIVKLYYLEPLNEIGAGLEVTVNKAVHDSLEPDLREIIKRAAMAGAAETTADFYFHNIQSFGPLLEEEGVDLRRFPKEVITAFAREAEIVLAELGATSDLAGEIYTSFTDYRAKCVEYMGWSDGAGLALRETGLRT
ncbi:MAG: TRAP transporter substrate-binding protein [Pseudomonadota bacterium]